MTRALATTLLLLCASAVQGRQPDCTRIKGCTSCRLTRVAGRGTLLLCDACDKGWTLRKDGQSRTCDCSAGWAVNKAGECTLCAKGMFCPGGDAASNPGNAAMSCPPGLTTTFTGAMSQSQCFTQPGYGRASTAGQDGTVAVSATLCGIGVIQRWLQHAALSEMRPRAYNRQPGVNKCCTMLGTTWLLLRQGHNQRQALPEGYLFAKL